MGKHWRLKIVIITFFTVASAPDTEMLVGSSSPTHPLPPAFLKSSRFWPRPPMSIWVPSVTVQKRRRKKEQIAKSTPPVLLPPPSSSPPLPPLSQSHINLPFGHNTEGGERGREEEKHYRPRKGGGRRGRYVRSFRERNKTRQPCQTLGQICLKGTLNGFPLLGHIWAVNDSFLRVPPEQFFWRPVEQKKKKNKRRVEPPLFLSGPKNSFSTLHDCLVYKLSLTWKRATENLSKRKRERERKRVPFLIKANDKQFFF